MDNQVQDKLNKLVRKTKNLLNSWPYMVVASDNEEIRQHFIKSLSKDVDILEDYDLYYPKRMVIHERLKRRHVLLLNFEQKIKEYIAHDSQCYNEEDAWMGVYDALIGFRDKFSVNNHHTIVIVCDNKMAYEILTDANLKSAAWTTFVDKELARKPLECYLPKSGYSPIFKL